MLIHEPLKFKKLYDVTHEDLFAALYDNRTLGLKVPDALISVIREADTFLVNNFKNEGVALTGNIQDYLPFHLSSDTINAVGRDKVINSLTIHTRMNKEQIIKFIDSLDYTNRPLNFSQMSSVIKEYNMEFKSGADVIEFFKSINSNDFELNILNEYFMQRQRLIRLANMQKIYGNYPVETLGKSIYKVRRGIKQLDRTLDRSYRAMVSDFHTKLELLSGKKFVDNEAWFKFSSAFNQTLSILTAAPARSAPRNLFIDYEGHKLAVGSSLYNGESNVGKSVSNIFRNLSFLLQQAIGNPEQKKAITTILDIAGWANSIDGMFQSNTLAFEDLFDRSPGINKTAKYAGWLDEKLRQSQDMLFKWSGNHSLIDIVRARRFMSIQQMFTNMLNHTDYDSWVNSLDARALQQLDFLRTNFNLDRKMFSFLQEASRTKVNFESDHSFALGFDLFPEFISAQSIIDTPDIIAAKYARPDETPGQFKARIAKGWQSFIYNSTTSHAPVPTMADSLTGPLLTNIPAWLSLTMRPFVKFADSAHAQFVDYLESAGTALYGRPTQFPGFGRSLMFATKGLLYYTAFGAATVWIKDLFNNRQPTDFTDPLNIARLTALTGFGGFPTMVASNALGIFNSKGSSLYAATTLGPAYYHANNLQRAVKNNSWGEAVIGLNRANPFTQLWYASGTIDFILNHTLLEKPELRRKYRNIETYGKPYLF